MLTAFAAAVALILVLGCANVGNLQLALGLARQREIATRMSLGASRQRIVRQLFTEGLVLACGAGTFAFALATVLPRVVFDFMGEKIPPYLAARFVPDWKILVFTLAVCVASCLVFALAPALQVTRVTIPLGALDRGSTRASRFHLRSLLLATQIAVCTVLLAGAGLVTRAIAHAMSFDPGFTVQGVDVISAALPSGTSMRERENFIQQTLAETVTAGGDPVAVAEIGPMDDSPFVMHVSRPEKGPMAFATVLRRRVSARYFDVLRIPLVGGRMFQSAADHEAVVNEAFVRAYGSGENILGHTAREVDGQGSIRRTHTIVGVVRDTYLTGLERSTRSSSHPPRSECF